MFVPRKHRPHPHLGPGLVQWQPVIANNQHVRIIPVAGTRELTKPILVLAVEIDDPENRIPRVVNIIEVSPKVAMLRNGLVVWILPWKKCKRKKVFCVFLNLSRTNLVSRPTAAVNHRSLCLVEIHPKLWVTSVHARGFRVAAIKLDIINTWGQRIAFY